MQNTSFVIFIALPHNMLCSTVYFYISFLLCLYLAIRIEDFQAVNATYEVFNSTCIIDSEVS